MPKYDFLDGLTRRTSSPLNTEIVGEFSGNVLENPGPNNCNLKFFHWNLDSLTARDNTKISLIEAYNAVTAIIIMIS